MKSKTNIKLRLY